MSDQAIVLIIQKLEEIGMTITSGIVAGVEYLYPVLLRQVYSEAIMYFLSFCIGILGTTLLFSKIIIPCYKNKTIFEYMDDENKVGVVLGCMFVGIPLIVTTIIGLYGFLPRLINPEWYALQMILKSF
jgi:hypothetical protein